ncbi:MAG: sigma-70 family RNA polymerase sigma factor [Lentisphaeraceae bacterium]|nr:sigma-70 family RNA polymerase sigma factor [Lentisphaeraceae bacterium]
MQQNMTRLTLLQKLKDECDDKAWEEFISLYKGFVYVVARKMGFSDADCLDVSQQVFLKVWQNVNKFEHGGRNGQFRKWLTTITRNTALNLVDKKKSHANKIESYENAVVNVGAEKMSQPEIDSLAQTEWKLYLANLAWSNIKDTVSKLMQDIFEFNLQGLTREQIAEKLEITVNTVSVYKLRVMNRYKKEFDRLQRNFG